MARDGKHFGKDVAAMEKKAKKFISKDLPKIVEVEGLAHIKKSFKDEGFTNSRLQKWKPRKTTDQNGRDITRYRTDKVGKIGSLNAFGRRNKGRSILTGHESGGNKLRNSFRTKRSAKRVVFFTYKDYAERHNEGKDGMAKRMFMGPSQKLDRKIEKKINRTLDTILK